MPKNSCKECRKETSSQKKKKKPAAKKQAAKNPVAKKPASKKTPKKAAKKAPAKKAAKKVVETSIIARVDVGFGNSLYVRGEGAGLSWEKGILLDNISPYEWAFKSTKASTPVEFKFLINDELWAEGENLTVAAGGTSISSPAFAW